MVMLSSTLRGRVIKFQSAAADPKDFQVLSFRGRESISTCYRYEIEMVSLKPDIDATRIIHSPASLGIKQGIRLRGGGRPGIQTLRTHGFLHTFEQSGRTMNWITYRAVLVPRLHRLSLNIQSRIFLDKTIPEIVEEVLKAGGFAPADYEFRLSARSYAKREYVVQYQESDLNFLSRWLEHEGIFFYFQQDDERDKVIFGDSPTANVPIQGEPSLGYRPVEGSSVSGDWFEQETIREWTFRETAIQQQVVLRDYNYRTPGVDLKVDAPIVSDGFGRFYEYGDHYKDQAEGKVYAQIRAEEIKARQKVFSGSGDGRSFRAGQTLNLMDHYRHDFNGPYLVTAIESEASQAVELGGGGGHVLAKYRNRFECISTDVVFRPARTTSKPRVTGVMHGRVDSAGDGKYAEIDDQGRYKIQIPFDLSGRDKARATRWIRMAQPYSGPNYGIHFPLHKGAEVILVHVDGDPDRPIIASAVPNPDTESPVKGANQSQCVIRTGGGNQIVIEDTEGSESIVMTSPNSATKMRMGAPR